MEDPRRNGDFSCGVVGTSSTGRDLAVKAFDFERFSTRNLEALENLKGIQGRSIVSLGWGISLTASVIWRRENSSSKMSIVVSTSAIFWCEKMSVKSWIVEEDVNPEDDEVEGEVKSSDSASWIPKE